MTSKINCGQLHCMLLSEGDFSTWKAIQKDLFKKNAEKETLNKLKSTLKKSKDFRENVLCKD